MWIYAQIDDAGRVIGISRLAGLVERPEMLELDAYREELLGCTWLGGATPADASQFATPMIPPPPPITRAELVARFTDDELGTIKRLAETNDTALGWVEWLQSQPTVALTDARLAAGLARLVAAGRIAQSRVDEILAETE